MASVSFIAMVYIIKERNSLVALFFSCLHSSNAVLWLLSSTSRVIELLRCLAAFVFLLKVCKLKGEEKHPPQICS